MKARDQNRSTNRTEKTNRFCLILIMLILSNSALLLFFAIKSCTNIQQKWPDSSFEYPSKRIKFENLSISGFYNRPSHRDSSLSKPGSFVQRVFVVGASHSGTSILERTIGNMIGVMCIGFESKLFVTADTRANRTAKLSMWDMLARNSGYTHWVEKTPAHICHLREIFATSPDAKIVWIHREPHKVALSLIVRRDNLFKDVWHALDFWAASNRCVLDMLPNPNILEVSYRDYTNTERVLSVLANISAFLGLAPYADPLALLGPARAERCHPATCQRYANDSAKREDLHAALLRTLTGETQVRKRRRGRKRDRHSERRSWQLCQPWYGTRHEQWARLANFSLRPQVAAIVRKLYPRLVEEEEANTMYATDSRAEALDMDNLAADVVRARPPFSSLEQADDGQGF